MYNVPEMTVLPRQREKLSSALTAATSAAQLKQR
jgi:hypothetical protein